VGHHVAYFGGGCDHLDWTVAAQVIGAVAVEKVVECFRGAQNFGLVNAVAAGADERAFGMCA
jgi:hypothetical protein